MPVITFSFGVISFGVIYYLGVTNSFSLVFEVYFNFNVSNFASRLTSWTDLRPNFPYYDDDYSDDNLLNYLSGFGVSVNLVS